MTARLSLLILLTVSYLGCTTAPDPIPREDLEFLLPQKITSLGKSDDGKLVTTFSMSARYFTLAADIPKRGPRMVRLANRQLKRAVRLRDPLYVTVQKTDARPRVVRMALTPDRRDSDQPGDR